MRFNFHEIEKARILKGMTQTRLAELADVDPSTVGRVEKGEIRNPPTIKKICDVLGLSMEEVFIDEPAQMGQ